MENEKKIVLVTVMASKGVEGVCVCVCVCVCGSWAVLCSGGLVSGFDFDTLTTMF